MVKINPIYNRPSEVGFSFMSAEEARDISVLKITNPVTFDAFKQPTNQGLYDRRLGPYDRGEVYV